VILQLGGNPHLPFSRRKDLFPLGRRGRFTGRATADRLASLDKGKPGFFFAQQAVLTIERLTDWA